jgi:LysM domain
MSSGSQTYKLAKGDTLDSVAKKFKVDSKTIWKAAENKALVSKRAKPEALQVGDQLAIPPNEKEAKEAALKIEQLRKMRDAAGAMLETLTREDDRSRRRVTVYNELIAGSRESTLEIVGELKRTLTDMKGWADGVDAVATVAQITASLTQICAKGVQATKLSGVALEKLNEELTKDVLKLPADQLKDVGIKFTGELRERTDSPLGYIGVVANSWEKMTAPSFWANTFVQMTQNGKSWSEAAAMDVGEDIQERMKMVVADGMKQIQTLEQKLAEARGQAAQNQKFIAECQARIKWCEQETLKADAR